MEDKKQQLASIVREAAHLPRKRRASPRKPAQTVRIEGDHNIVGDGNTVIRTEKVVHKQVSPPPPGSITPDQAQTIRELLAEWKTVHDRVKKTPLTWASAWERLKKKFRVNSYLNIPSSKFEEVVNWLRARRAEIDNMKSAATKDPDWRARQIAYIKARCKNQLGNEYAYVPYITSRFSKTTLADLTNEELTRTKAYIAHKKTA